MRILTVVDSHCILNQYPTPEEKNKIIRIFDCLRDGEYFEEDMQDYNIQIKSLFIGDSKPYWRSFMDPNYKANRPKRSIAFPKAIQLKGYEDSLYIENFEADDIAGLIWRMWPQLRYEFDYLVFSTIDSDWMQLLTDTDILILDQKGYLPAYRSSTSCWLWVKNQLKSPRNTKKAKAELEAILEICNRDSPDYWANVIRTFKHRCGDKTDNIPPMADECMTNLLVKPKGDFGLELDSYRTHIQKLITKQSFRPAKYCSQYVEDCVIQDHTRIPLVDRRNWEEMRLKKYESPDLLAFMM